MEEKIKHNHVDSVTESLLLCDVGLYGIIVAIADQKNTVFISVMLYTVQCTPYTAHNWCCTGMQYE